MSLDVTAIVQFLNAISTVAVIAGVVFVVFQLRQNARLIEESYKQNETSIRQVEATIQQNKLQVILSTMERFTNEEFDRKRKKVREIVKEYQARDWAGYSESEDDFLVRGFIALYDTTAYLGRMGIVDVKLIQEGMGLLVMNDWDAVKPAVDHYRTIWNRNAYANFRWLNDSLLDLMKREESAT